MPPSATAICAIPPRVSSALHPHPRAPVVAELQRVGDQVLQQLLELRAVAHAPRAGRRSRSPRPPPPARAASERSTSAVTDAELDPLVRVLAAARARVGQQRLDQPAHPARAVDRVLDELVRVRVEPAVVAAAQQLEVARDHPQRLAQVVRGDVGELLRARRSSAPARRRRRAPRSRRRTRRRRCAGPRARARRRAWRPTASASSRPGGAARAARRPAERRSPPSSAAAGPPRPAGRRPAPTKNHSGSLPVGASTRAGSMPRMRRALGLAATSRPVSSTISTPSSSDSTSERNASRLRSDARQVDEQHGAQRADERRVDRAPTATATRRGRSRRSRP